MHKSDPSHYKDDNHKPELAIALTTFEALCAFRNIKEIQSFLKTVPEFAALISKSTITQFLGSTQQNKKDNLRLLFTELMNCSKSAVDTQLQLLRTRCSSSTDPLDQLVLRISAKYPGDLGVFCVFMLNYITLQPGECVFLAPNEPHAYLRGNCIECMACSDNVVRSVRIIVYPDEIFKPIIF